jgi:hypothetical protein
MIHNHWHIIAYRDSQPLAKHSSPLCTTTGGFEIWSVVLSQPVVVNHGVICWASRCEPWCVILSQWVVLNHEVLWWTSCCESWYAILSQWLWINNTLLFTTNDSAYQTMIHNHSLAQYNKPWFTTTGSSLHSMIHCCASGCESCCALLSQWLWLMICNVEPLSGCESWWWFTTTHLE